MVSHLFNAYEDLKYLLNRGYRKNVALKFVSNHYRLRKEDRHLLARCVFSDGEIETREKKRKPIDFVKGKTLAIDGFNVLITLESVLEGKAILCEDGFVRDLKYQRGYKLSEKTEEMLFLLLEFLFKFHPKGLIFFYDRPVSKSGKIAKLTNEIMEKVGLSGKAEAVNSVDFELEKFEIVATSDLAVINKVKYVVDIPQEFAKSRGIKIKGLKEILKESH